MGHYLRNTGTGPLRFLDMFKSSYCADLSLGTWMAVTPLELMQAHLKLDQQVMDALRKQKAPIVPEIRYDFNSFSSPRATTDRMALPRWA